jgi:hypothetical protein
MQNLSTLYFGLIVICGIVLLVHIRNKLFYTKLKKQMLFALYYDGDCELEYLDRGYVPTLEVFSFIPEMPARHQILDEFSKNGWIEAKKICVKNKYFKTYSLTESGRMYIEKEFKIKKKDK